MKGVLQHLLEEGCPGQLFPMNGFSADLAYIFYEAKAELLPGGEDKESVPKFYLSLLRLWGDS